MIDDYNLMGFVCFVLFFAAGKVIALEDNLVPCTRKDILNANITYKVIAIQKNLVQLAIVYSHDVIEINDNFNLLGIGERLTPVFLQIAVTLLNKCLSQNIKINNLFINIES